MTLKDWREVKLTSCQSKEDMMFTRRNPFGNITIDEFQANYFVNIEYGTVKKKFKTKSQALKFAKSYMRKY